MAQKNIDFSAQLPHGTDPVSPNGSLLIQAAQTEAQSAAVSADSTNKLLKAGVSTALAGAKGYLESGLESDIKKTVDQYELSTKFDSAMQKYDILAQNEAQPADLLKAQEEVTKYKTALDQGLITREQAILSIDKSVKDYSNVLPGYASDLRKLAQTLTGVEHLGNYREYALLSKVSQAEKLRADQVKFEQDTQQKMVTMFVDKYKRLPQGGLNGSDMKLFREEAALTAHAEGLKTRTEIRGATIAQTEPVVVDLINARQGQGIMQLNQRLQGVVNAVDPKTGQLMSPENKILLRQRVLSDVSNFFEGLKSEVLGFNSNQLSNATRETILTRLGTQQKDLVTALQNQDSFDDFNKTMKLNADKASDVMNKWAIANPHLKIVKESGLITPDVAKLWIDKQREPRGAAEFRKIYGNSIDDFFKSVASGGSTANYENNANKAGSDPDYLEKLKDVDPGQYQVQLHILRDSIKQVSRTGWGEDVETQDLRKKKFSTWLTSFAGQIDLAKPDMVSEWTKLVSDPMVASRIKELPEQDQLQAIDPIYRKTRSLLENPELGLFKRLGQLQKESADQFFFPKQFEVSINSITNQFEIVQRNQKTGKLKNPLVDVTSSGGNLMAGEVKQVLANINRSVVTLNNFKDIKGVVPQDLQKTGLALDYLNKFNAGYFDLSNEERNKALGGSKASPASSKEVQGLLDQATAYYNDPKRLEEMGKIRSKEVGNDPLQIQKNIDALSSGLAAMKNGSPEQRKILKSELSAWTKALELLQGKQ